MLNALLKTNNLLQAAIEAKIINGYTLIGGLALAVWDIPRATRDIDLIVYVDRINEEKLLRFLSENAVEAEMRRSDIFDPVPLLIKAEIDSVTVEIICATKKWELEAINNSSEVEIGNERIPVVNPEYLIILKLKANGPRDRLDIKELVKHDKVDMDKLHNLTKSLRLSGRLNAVIGRHKTEV